jgi:hypothetical protein
MTTEQEITKRAGLRFFEGGRLFGIATQAAKDIKAPDPLAGGHLLALTSIVFSVISLEAFLNEMTESAEDNQHHDYEPQVVGLFARVMRDMENASLETKLVMSGWVLTGKNSDRGAHPFQDLGSLVALRNQLVHFKPSPLVPLAPGVAGSTEEVNRKYLKRLEAKNILAPSMYQGSWVYHATTRAVAEWSCKTVSDMVSDFASKVPNSMWGTTVKGIAGSFKMT